MQYDNIWTEIIKKKTFIPANPKKTMGFQSKVIDIEKTEINYLNATSWIPGKISLKNKKK